MIRRSTFLILFAAVLSGLSVWASRVREVAEETISLPVAIEEVETSQEIDLDRLPASISDINELEEIDPLVIEPLQRVANSKSSKHQ